MSYTAGIVLVFSISLVMADFDCLCNFNVEVSVFPTDTVSGQPIGYLYEFDCKPLYGNSVNAGSNAIQYEGQVGYVKTGSNTKIQICPGEPSTDDLVTTTIPMSSTKPPSTDAHNVFTNTATSSAYSGSTSAALKSSAASTAPSVISSIPSTRYTVVPTMSSGSLTNYTTSLVVSSSSPTASLASSGPLVNSTTSSFMSTAPKFNVTTSSFVSSRSPVNATTASLISPWPSANFTTPSLVSPGATVNSTTSSLVSSGTTINFITSSLVSTGAPANSTTSSLVSPGPPVNATTSSFVSSASPFNITTSSLVSSGPPVNATTSPLLSPPPSVNYTTSSLVSPGVPVNYTASSLASNGPSVNFITSSLVSSVSPVNATTSPLLSPGQSVNFTSSLSSSGPSFNSSTASFVSSASPFNTTASSLVSSGPPVNYTTSPTISPGSSANQTTSPSTVTSPSSISPIITTDATSNALSTLSTSIHKQTSDMVSTFSSPSSNVSSSTAILSTIITSTQTPRPNSRDCGPVPKRGSNSYLVSSTGSQPGDSALYACDTGYQLVTGDLTIHCYNAGRWEPTPSCDSQVITGSTTTIPASSITTTTKPLSSSMSSSSSTSVPLTGCGQAPDRGQNAQLVSSTGTHSGDKAVYECDPGYQLISGSLTIACYNHGSWDKTPTCALGVPQGRVDLCPYQMLAHTPYNSTSRTYPRVIQYGQYCYEYCPEHGDWYRARADCSSKGGYLLILTNNTVQIRVTNLLLRQQHPQEVWMGLNDLDQHGTWKWINGDSLSGYSSWGHHDPVNAMRDNCALLNPLSGLWEPVACKGFLMNLQAHPWVCQYRAAI